MTEKTESLDLSIDSTLHKKLSTRAEKMGFESAEEYSKVVLHTVINELETSDNSETQNNSDVKDRLEDLGYMS